MTTTTPRPNRDALNKAIDVYRDAMRPFIVRTLKANAKGVTVQDAIRQALQSNPGNRFAQNLRENGGSVEGAIDIADFPPILSWRNKAPFKDCFEKDKGFLSKAFLVMQGRHDASHPGGDDMDIERVRVTMYHVIDMLGVINHAAQKAEVEAIRDALTATPPAQPAPPEPQPAPAAGKPVPAASGKPAPRRGARPLT